MDLPIPDWPVRMTARFLLLLPAAAVLVLPAEAALVLGVPAEAALVLVVPAGTADDAKAGDDAKPNSASSLASSSR